MVLLDSSFNYWTKCCILGFYLKHHECLLGFFIQLDIVMPFSSPQLELDWESMSNFLRLERNLHIFGHIFLAVSIFLFWPTKARGTNVRQFLTRCNIQIMNISSCLGVISFYFPPLEVVHPVRTLAVFSSKPREEDTSAPYSILHTASYNKSTTFLLH